MVLNAQLMHTSNLNADTIPRDVSSAIGYLAPKISQILFIAAKPQGVMPNAFGTPEIGGAKGVTLGARVTTNFKYEWMEDSMHALSTAVNNGGGYNSAATSIVVDDASIFTPNDLIDVVSTGEILQVLTVTTGTNTITVTRSIGATAAASIADNAVLLIIGNSYTEAGGYKIGAFKNPVVKYNYIQDTRHHWSTSDLTNHLELYYGDQRKYMAKKKLEEHTLSIERSVIMGERSSGTGADGSPQFTCGGLLEMQGSSNVLAVGGTLSKSTWNTWLKDLFTYGGSNERLLIGSPTVMAAISNFATDTGAAPKSQMWVMNNAKDFGMNIMSYNTKFGTVHLIMHGLFTGDTYSGYALGIDPMNIQLVRLRGGDFFSHYEDITKIGDHVHVDEYRTYFGLEYKNPETGGLLTGVTG